MDPNPNLSLISKLPIKRKIYDPNPNLEHLSTGDGEDNGGEGRPAPYKFHRIWTEPDEIRFLQCLLESTDLSFPRDLYLFYSRFKTTSPSHAYTKSQLYEKLRRLRRKFRATSSRLAGGRVALSPHDSVLFDLSKRLWHPDFSSSSPFSARGGGSGNNNTNRSSSTQKNDNKKSNLVGVRVSFSPTLDIDNRANASNRVGDDDEDDDEDFEEDHVVDGGSVAGFDGGIDNVQLSEVNVELDEDDVEERELAMPAAAAGGGVFGGGVGEVVAKTVMNVFDQSLDEVRTVLAGDLGSDGAADGLEKRWREQRVAELDVLGQRLRLVLEHSLRKQ